MTGPPDKERAAPALDRTALKSDSRGGEIQSKSTPEAVAALDEPDPFASRRRFLVWCLMAGYVKPERMVERVVAEVEAEATP